VRCTRFIALLTLPMAIDVRRGVIVDSGWPGGERGMKRMVPEQLAFGRGGVRDEAAFGNAGRTASQVVQTSVSAHRPGGAAIMNASPGSPQVVFSRSFACAGSRNTEYRRGSASDIREPSVFGRVRRALPAFPKTATAGVN
jgi:hypothetical protein